MMDEDYEIFDIVDDIYEYTEEDLSREYFTVPPQYKQVAHKALPYILREQSRKAQDKRIAQITKKARG